MACFIVPATEALVASAANALLKRNHRTQSLTVTHKTGLLSKYLWGGSALLLLDHIVTGEVTLHYPFFTEAPALIWHEMATTGVALAAGITLFWGIQWLSQSIFSKQAMAQKTTTIQENQ